MGVTDISGGFTFNNFLLAVKVLTKWEIREKQCILNRHLVLELLIKISTLQVNQSRHMKQFNTSH